MKVFKKSKINISFGYLASVLAMAILYFLLSNMYFEVVITEYCLVALDWVPPLKHAGSILILAGLIVYWVIILIYRSD